MVAFTRKTDGLGRITLGKKLCQTKKWELGAKLGFLPDKDALIIFGEESGQITATWSRLEQNHRIVVPVEYRTSWGYQRGDRIRFEILVTEGKVMLRPAYLQCAGCGSQNSLAFFGIRQIAICPACLCDLKAKNEINSSCSSIMTEPL